MSRQDETHTSAEQAEERALAEACAAGEPGAIEAFESRYFQGVDRAVAGVVSDPGAIDEVRQELRRRLFVGQPPPVVDYAGQGDLSRFVQVAALRIAINLRRGDARRRVRDGQFAGSDPELANAVADPELDFIKHNYRSRFKVAFERAIESLTSRERNLLRCHLQQHLGIDEIGALYGVHRATAARWLAAARTAVSERTRAHLRQALHSDADLEELLAIARSKLDLSISRVLASRPDTR